MVNKNYQKGYRFQQRVKKYLEKEGYFVILSPKSRFPDGVAILEGKTFFFECKWNKYLTKEEKEKGKELMLKWGMRFVVFWNNYHKLSSYKL